ncbi:methyltransferase domain-containing protein [Ruminiclostridium josui]|uniref:methyltransferase domain-containing protein n=1 Tax=Ruminiclostridium josui TaxID=1499 RepID=UPI0004651562|nr:class I SAM-dependent methyltransferase [Ruminiclostridium josui]
MSRLVKELDFKSQKSISYKLRRKRMQLLERLLEGVCHDSNGLKIIDIGGTQAFWDCLAPDFISRCTVTLLNLKITAANRDNFISILGDATNMSEFGDKTFDLAFSNSVIEHIGDFEAQKKMAMEVQRVGKMYFLQTPNKHFPVEPHFIFPFFQYLPLCIKVFLISHFNLGPYKRITDKDKAKALGQSIRLLTKKELKKLFPSANIYEEKVLGLTKSFIVYDFRV